MFNYFKTLSLCLLILSLCTLQLYTMEDTTKRFWYHVYKSTGYQFTRNDTLRDLVQEIVCSENYTFENLNTIKQHIKKGANPNVRACYKTPLYLLIKILKDNPQQFVAELEELVGYGLDVNKYIDSIDTALSYVISLYFTNIHQLWKHLIAYGADVNKRDAVGLFPLITAINCQNSEAMKYLLQNKAKIIDVDANQGTVFHYLANRPSKIKNPEMVETIISHACFFDDEEDTKEAIKAQWAVANWSNKLTWTSKSVGLPKEVQYLILSKLFETDDFFHAGLYQKLVDMNYDQHSPIPAKNYVKRLFKILQMKNADDYTAVYLLYSNLHRGDQQLLKKLEPLFNGTRLREDIKALAEASDPEQVSPDNLAFQISNNFRSRLKQNF